MSRAKTDILNGEDAACFVFNPQGSFLLPRHGYDLRNPVSITVEENDGTAEVWAGFHSVGSEDNQIAVFPVGIVYIEWERPA